MVIQDRCGFLYEKTGNDTNKNSVERNCKVNEWTLRRQISPSPYAESVWCMDIHEKIQKLFGQFSNARRLGIYRHNAGYE